MNFRAHGVTQRAINRLMALHQRLPLKVLAHDQSFKVIAAASEIAHLDMSPRQTVLDSFLKVISVHFEIS